jgi:hypothetical protein
LHGRYHDIADGSSNRCVADADDRALDAYRRAHGALT